LAQQVPALRLLTRPEYDIRATADRICAVLASRWPDRDVTVQACSSQIGSGALPVDMLPSAAVTIGGNALESISKSLRERPRPVIGHIAQGRLWLDCRCLEQADEAAFVAQFA
jgi:L-seryl-tRNA(Ser) seleniumtransferase